MTTPRPPDGLGKTSMVLASFDHEVRLAIHRRRMAVVVMAFFASVFVVLVAGETLFATLMFALISVEILGTVVSGAAFALLVPTVICAAHVKLHYEADHFTHWWLRRLSSIGILIFVLGMSLMVGFSAWQAAQDAVSVIASGPRGSLGNVQVDAAPDQSSGLERWIGLIPNSLLFLGLAFGMIITIYVASFCLGHALQAFNLLTQTPPISKEIKSVLDGLKSKMTAYRSVLEEDEAARWKLPLDLKQKFARLAFHACWKVAQTKRAAARRKFGASHLGDPLAAQFNDTDVESIPSRFKDEQRFNRHLDDQMDSLRTYNLLRILTGLPEEGDKS